MKYAIVEDDENLRLMFIDLLSILDKSFELIGQADSVSSGIQLLNSIKPDIVFLDVEIKEGKTFDILSELKNIPFEIVFVTAYEKYAIEAIQWNAFDYIVKPIVSSKVTEVLNKVKSRKIKGTPVDRIQMLNQKITGNKPDKILLRTQEEIQAVKLDDIIYCASDLNYTTFYTINSKILVSKPLSEFEEMLSEYDFFRIHKQYLLNLNHFKKYVRADGGTIIVTNDIELPLASRKKEIFLDLLSNRNKFL